VHGGNIVHGEDGAFGEYLTAKGDLVIRIPDEMTFEEAATLGVGIITCGQGLYQQMGLPGPDTADGKANGQAMLIYGGSTATGMHGIQFAKLYVTPGAMRNYKANDDCRSGFEVITTCSSRNFDLVKSFGADHAFDYTSPTCAADIRKLTNDKLMYAWDTVSEGSSPKICCDALASSGNPKYGTILKVTDLPRNDVQYFYSLGYTMIGEDFRFRGDSVFKAVPEDFEFGVKWNSVAGKLLAQGKLKPLRKDIRSGGLEGIFQGLSDLKEGRVSGTKLVYRISQEQGILPVQ
jgi:NADPH:quinone reductase-like Zn-dependent oxidoreductase